jgi:serine/threonine protein kinase
MGTAGYLSPEQQAVVTPDFPQDIYSLGALMIESFKGISLVKLHTDMHILTRDIVQKGLSGIPNILSAQT